LRGVAALCVAAALAGCGEYEAIDLSKLSSDDGFQVWAAKAINNHGEIVGETIDAKTGARGSPGFRLREGRVETLGLLDGSGHRPASHPLAINDAGVAVGYASKGKLHVPVVFEPGKPMRELAVESNGTFTAAYAISNNGLIAGAFYPGKYNISFLLNGASFTALGAIGTTDKGVVASYPSGVNDRGQVIGRTSIDGGFGAFLWEAGNMRALPALPEHAEPGAEIVVYAINNAGQAVGCSGHRNAKEFVPVLWQPDGRVIKLGSPGINTAGARQGCAHGINSKGVVAGFISTPKGDSAFIWDPSAGLRDLNELTRLTGTGWKRLLEAKGVNDRGEIIGDAEGKEENSPRVPFLLRPRKPLVETVKAALRR
jgi:uncharacterized membrane protein